MTVLHNRRFPGGGVYLLMAALCAALAFSARAEFTCELSFPQAPSTALANFPVLVRLAEGAPTGFSYADCPTASCIWFTDENDDAIPCDVDTWDTTSNSLVWVSVPSLSSSAKITMHWDASGAPAGQPASSQVWSLADYVGVWHMNEILEDNGLHYTPDASASGWNAYKANEADGYPVTISDAGIAASAPPTGHAMVNQLNDNNRTTGGFIVPSTLTSGTTIGPFTISFFEASAANGNDRVVGFGTSYPQGCITAGTGNTYVMAPGGFETFNYSDGLANNAWRHIAGIFDANLAGYIGGAYRNLNKPVSNYSVTLSNGIGLGTFTGHTETFRGNLDEIRIRNVASTGEWVAEEYKTVTTANYVTFGDVEGGGATVELLRIGTPTVSDITAVSATVSGRLTKFGEGATSALVSLHYTDGGAATNTVALGSTNAVPAVFTAALANLTPSTAYTVWFSAVNNAATPASTNSVAVVFSTCVDETEWDTSTATFTRDGRTITATVDITNVGSGSSTLYLMTGSAQGAVTTVSASTPVTSTGTATVFADLSDNSWGTKMFAGLMLVNGTAQSAITNIYNRSGDLELRDDSTYTWIGGSAGVWNVLANWEITAAGSLAPTHPSGYPVVGSTAKFATEEGDGPITVTIPAAQGTSYDANDLSDKATCWFTMYLDLDGMHEPLVFTSEDKTAPDCQFRAYRLTAKQTYNRLVFDDCNVYLYSINSVGATAADANGENFAITLTGGTTAKFNGFAANRPGVKVRVEDGATLNAGGLTGGTAAPPPVLEIDGGTVTAGKLEPDTWSSVNGTMVRLVGAGSVFTPQWLQLKYATSTNVFEFVVPVGGYTAVPVQFTSGSNKFPNNTNDAKMTLRVSKDSPGLGSIGSRGIQLLQSPAGINAANVRFEDVKPNRSGFFFKDADGNEYADAAAIEAAEKTAAQITQIWYRSPAQPLTIVVR